MYEDLKKEVYNFNKEQEKESVHNVLSKWKQDAFYKKMFLVFVCGSLLIELLTGVCFVILCLKF